MISGPAVFRFLGGLKGPGTAGDVMDDLFSAPKVQMARVVGKFLLNSPAAQPSEIECSRQMTEAVSSLACFTEHICGDGKGTSVEGAAQVLSSEWVIAGKSFHLDAED